MKRTIKKQFWFSRDEAQDLQKKAKKTCLSEAALVRLLLRGYEPKEKPDDRFCIQETGSRIVASRNKSKKADKDCVSANGRVYTRQDIESTGSVDLRDALRRLDPSIN